MVDLSWHPMQAVYRDKEGVVRFRPNKIIEWLLDNKRFSLNEIAYMDFKDEDRMQLAQLIGYSVSGFGDLSYAAPELVELADLQFINPE